MTEMLTDVLDGAILELQPRYLRKRMRAMRYGAGDHAAKTRHGGALGAGIVACFAVALTMFALVV